MFCGGPEPYIASNNFNAYVAKVIRFCFHQNICENKQFLYVEFLLYFIILIILHKQDLVITSLRSFFVIRAHFCL